MECARLSDAELLPLVREEGESSRESLRELERRHLHAVRAFAAVCTVSSESADELAANAWRRAMTLREGTPVGAVRPHALCSVLRTTADWAGTDKRSELQSELVDWIQSYVAEGRGDSAADDFPRTSMAARAFGSLPERSQTVLWHYAVEYDGVARIDQLLGGGMDEVSVLDMRARRELYNSYLRIYGEESPGDECRRLHRTVLAYVDHKSMETAAELTPHLEGCAHCSQAVDDLGLMHVHCGALLAEALLPWGGPEYAAASLPSSSAAGGRRPAVHGAEGDDRDGARAGAAAAAGRGSGERSYEGRLTGRLRELTFRRSNRPDRPDRPDRRGGGRAPGRLLGGLLGGPVAGGARSEPRPGDGKRRHQRKRVLQSAALVGLCSLVVAVVYTGAFRSGAPQSAASPPAQGVSQPPAPPSSAPPRTATATATATVTATRTASPPRSSPPGATGEPTGGILPVDAALEWLFDTLNGATTVDTSDNGVIGLLFGDPLPQLLNGALRFNGSQDVSSEGSVLDTERSFSVSTRVQLLDKGSTQTVVSQDGFEVSGFALQYDAEEDRWSMGLRDDDAQDVETDRALSDSRPRAGQWTHLAGVYDDDENEIRLYVDGRLEDTATHDGDWPAEGDFAVGRGLLGGGPFQWFRGAIDEVRAFDRALSAREARGLADRR